MIALDQLRKNPEYVFKKVGQKDPSAPIEKLFELDQQVRELQMRVEQLRAQKNQLANQAQSGITPEIRQQSVAVGAQLKSAQRQLEEVMDEFLPLYRSIGNLIDDQVVVGRADDNQVLSEHGQKPTFNFEPKNHMQLGQDLDWLDFHAAARMSGSNFALYKGDGVKLLYALTMFMLDHNAKNGYQLIFPPYLVNETSLEVSGNFPKFKDQVYAIEQDKLYLSPTSEVNITNIYRDHIFDSNDLPKRYTAWTSCFRREAGGYGAHERGLIRIHQFEKVELYTFCTPEVGYQEFEKMVTCATDILKQLGIVYRVVALASQEVSFSAAKTYDIEIWLAGQREWVEVSSISLCTDFQARRGAIRYRHQPADKPQLVYTLNGSSLALPRLMVAIMENFQQADGTVAVPEILTRYGIYSH